MISFLLPIGVTYQEWSFTDELITSGLLTELECFKFKIEPDPGDLTSIDLGIRKNASTTNVNVPLEDDQSSLFAYVVWIFLAFLTTARSRFLRLKNSISGDNSLHSNDSDNTALSDYVIYLDGEGLVDLMMENNCNATAQWIKMGGNKQPRNLIKLLENSNLLSSFSGVREFDSDKVPSLCSREPPNCWALPIVTLTTIAVSLPNIDKESIQLLVSGVDEGLKYVTEIEKYMDKKNDLTHVRKAAEVIWSGVELYNKWLYVDLSKLAHP
ncbi:hypothetical protein Tco_0438541, partial [Tanacetum coccineum]